MNRKTRHGTEEVNSYRMLTAQGADIIACGQSLAEEKAPPISPSNHSGSGSTTSPVSQPAQPLNLPWASAGVDYRVSGLVLAAPQIEHGLESRTGWGICVCLPSPSKDCWFVSLVSTHAAASLHLVVKRRGTKLRSCDATRQHFGQPSQSQVPALQPGDLLAERRRDMAEEERETLLRSRLIISVASEMVVVREQSVSEHALQHLCAREEMKRKAPLELVVVVAVVVVVMMVLLLLLHHHHK
ncbi:hypothetical protein E2C01_066229 [Portunus trituberculatus]|uniref:Uncharacterized protein n=1 Tax=Portunus trituberculatus TaxID=210409 RepID=A0A5B7HRR5_PORTR|nr:hypothetical protein [Portunus trituberculatus]